MQLQRRFLVQPSQCTCIFRLAVAVRQPLHLNWELESAWSSASSCAFSSSSAYALQLLLLLLLLLRRGKRTSRL
jgi:hypothetical protein